jgi:4-amino-4-deoxy-L-arabinose transferase-like glycosyltransferase
LELTDQVISSSEDATPTVNWWPWSLLAVTFLGAALRFGALGAKTVWLDEAFSLWMVRHDLPSLIDWLIRIDHHPPLYYILLHYWVDWFGDSPSALRTLSALTSSLAIPLYGLAARRLAGARVGIVATLIFALAPFHVRYGQEARMYGVMILAVALLLFALAHVLMAEGKTTSRWWMWGLLAVAEAAAMLTHNTATVLVPLALNGVIVALWLAYRAGRLDLDLAGLAQPRFWRMWLLSQAGALLLWLPWAWPFIHQAQVVDAEFWISPPNLGSVWQVLSALTFDQLPEWVRHPATLFALGLAFWGFWRWGVRSALGWLLLGLWLLPPIVELLVSIRRPIFYDRTLIWTTLPYYLLIARGLVPPVPLRKSWQGGLVALYVLLCVASLWSYYAFYTKEEWDKVSVYVAAHAQPNDLVLFHASWVELPFNYHYPSDAPPLVHHGVPADLFDAGALEPPMTAADAARVQQLVADQNQVWLVYSHWWYTDPQEILLEVLDGSLEVAEVTDWPGIRVVRYVRP